MKTFYLTLLCVSACFVTVSAQQKDIALRIELQYDTVGLYEQFQVKYIVENAQSVQLNTPDFSEFMLVAGPFQNSQLSIINGVTSSSVCYTYILQPKDKGSYVLPAASINTKGETLHFPEATLVVAENVTHTTPASPFGTMPGFDDNAMNDLYKRQEELLKRHQDMFNDLNDPFGMFKDLENRIGPTLEEMLKNMENAFQFKLPPLEQPKPKEKTYKL